MKKVFLRNKLISLLLCVCVLMTMSPVQAYATDGLDGHDHEQEQIITDGNVTEAVCSCGTDDPLYHATTCPVYVAPETPECKCVEKCTEVNEWCSVCGFDYTACTGTGRAAGYGGSYEIEGSSVLDVGCTIICTSGADEGVKYIVLSMPTDDINGTVSVCGYSGNANAVTIPTTITCLERSFDVTKIEDGAFEGTTVQCTTHRFTDSACDVCDFVCTHEAYEDGKCAVCELTCEHSGEATDNGDGTHSYTCETCGESITGEAHDFSDNYTCSCGKKQDFTVTWDNGSGGYYDKDYTYGSKIAIPTSQLFEETVRKPCHQISGWVCSVEGIKVGDSMPAQTLTFTAVYALTEHTGTTTATSNGDGTHDGVWSCCNLTIDDEAHILTEDESGCAVCNYEVYDLWVQDYPGEELWQVTSDRLSGATWDYDPDSNTLKANTASMNMTQLKSGGDLNIALKDDSISYGSARIDTLDIGGKLTVVNPLYHHVAIGNSYTIGDPARSTAVLTLDNSSLFFGEIENTSSDLELVEGREYTFVYNAHIKHVGEGAVIDPGAEIYCWDAGGDKTLHTHDDESGESSYINNDDGTHNRINECPNCPIGYKTIAADEKHSLDESGKCICGYQSEASYTTAGGGVAYDTLENALDNVADGGTVTLLKDVTDFYATEANINNTVTLELNGKIVSSESNRYPILLIGGQGNLTVQDSSGKDGKLESTDNLAILLNSYGGSLTVLSGTISGTPGICSNAKTNIQIKGGTVLGTGGSGTGIYVTSESALTVAGGTVNGGSGYGIQAMWGSTVDITGSAAIEGGNYGISAYNLTFSGGSSTVDGGIQVINHQGITPTGLTVESGASLVCNGKIEYYTTMGSPVPVTVNGLLKVNASNYAFNTQNSSSTIAITVEGGVLDATASSIVAHGKATFTIKGNSHVRLQGNIYTNALNVEPANYYWYCGDTAPTEGYTHSSTEAAAFVHYDKYFELFTGDHLTFNAETTTATCPHGVSIPVAASVTTTDDSTTYYTDLSTALKAATNGSTVKLLKGITTDETITLTGNDWIRISLDFNGNTVQGTHANAVFKLINGRTVTLKDSASGGTIVTDTGWGVQVDDGELIIEDGVTVMGSSSGVNFLDGRLIVNGGSIKGFNANNGNGIVIGGGIAEVNGGTITGGASGIHANGGTVTVTGGTIQGERYGINAVGENADVTVDGGTLHGPYALYASGSVTLNGGTLNGRQADIVVAMPFTVGDLGSANYTLTTAPDNSNLPVQVANGDANVTVNPAWFTYVYLHNGEADNHYVILPGDRQVNGAALIEGGQANELYLYYCQHSSIGNNGVCDTCGTEFAAMVIDGDSVIAKTEYYTTLDAAVNAANASRTDKKTILLLRDATGDVTIIGDNIRLTSGDNKYTLNGTVTTQARNTLLEAITIRAGADYGVVVSAGYNIIPGHGLSIESTKADIYLHEGSGTDLSQGTDESYTVSAEDLPDTVGGKRFVSTGSHADKLSSADPNYYIVVENGQTYLANRFYSVSVTLGNTPATQGSEPDTWTAEYNGKNAHALGVWIDDAGLESSLSESWWEGNTKLDSFPTDVGTYGFTLHHPYAEDNSEPIYEGILTITKAGISSIYWNGYPDSVSYNGQPLKTPDVDFRMSDGTEKSPNQILWREYDAADNVPWNEGTPTNVGRYTFRARLDLSQNYSSGYAEHTVEILPAELSISAAVLNAKVWDGTTAAEVKEVTFNGLACSEILVPDEDYTVTAAFENADAGVGKNVTVTVTLKNTAQTKNYTLTNGAFTAVGDIAPKSVSPEITLSFDSAVYTGEAIQPEVTVKDGDMVVPTGEYTVKYINNVNVGTATVIVTDKNGGNYVVNGSTTFIINKADPVIGTVGVDGVVKDNTKPSEVVLTRTNTAVDGVLKLTDDAMLANKSMYRWVFTPIDTDNYNVINGDVQIDVLDTVLPTAVIKVDTNDWKQFINNITFGLFFKDSQEVTITAADNENGSGIKDILYCVSDRALDENDLAAVEWKTYIEAFDIEPDGKFVIYAKITDNDGNTVVINSDGVVVDKTAAVVSGITDGETYYGQLVFTVTDEFAGVKSVVIDGDDKTHIEGQYAINGDNAEHTVTVTDNAGNVAEYKITVCKNYTVTYTVNGEPISTETVGHGKDAILPAVPGKEGYVGKWDSDGKNIIGDTIISAIYTELPVVKTDEVKPEDKTTLENTKEELKELMNDDSYAEDEKKDIQDAINDIDDALEVIGNVEEVEKLIGKLPETIKKNDEPAIKAADNAYNALTDYEKSLVDKEAKKALDDAKAALAELNKPADPNSPETGDTSNMMLWIILSFISGSVVITLIVVDRKRRTASKK